MTEWMKYRENQLISWEKYTWSFLSRPTFPLPSMLRGVLIRWCINIRRLKWKSWNDPLCLPRSIEEFYNNVFHCFTISYNVFHLLTMSYNFFHCLIMSYNVFNFLTMSCNVFHCLALSYIVFLSLKMSYNIIQCLTMSFKVLQCFPLSYNVLHCLEMSSTASV